MAIRWEYIERWEGTGGLKGLYVPMSNGKAIENSGVTAPCGLDLGQLSMREFYEFDFSPVLYMLLSKYVGIKGEEAVKLLNRNGIDKYSFMPNEQQEITKKVRDRYTTKIEKEYNKYSPDIKFKDLTDYQQTVIASVAFQHGSLAKAAPNFLRQVTSQDWYAAINNLRNFTTKKNTKGVMLHSWRRNEEADLLLRDLV